VGLPDQFNRLRRADVLPDPQNRPTLTSESCIDPLVACPISGELSSPVRSIRTGLRAVHRTAVPEATVQKDYESRSREHDVRLYAQICRPDPQRCTVPISERPEGRTKRSLGSCVSAAVAAHCSRCCSAGRCGTADVVRYGDHLVTRIRAKPLTLIDLFSGAGGVTRGFLPRDRWSALPEFRSVCAVDLDPSAVATYAHNFPAIPVVKADITSLGFGEIRSLLRRVDLRTGDLDVLVACPPCQSYSRNNHGRRADDERNHLYWPAIDWVRMARPKAVLIENVDALKASDGGRHDSNIRSVLTELNYSVDAWDLEAVDYGVPQHRVRRFYLAYRGDLGLIPRPPRVTHHSLEIRKKPSWVTVSQAIDDLPVLSISGEGSLAFTTRAEPGSPTFRARQGAYASMMRAEKGTPVTHHWTPPLSPLAERRLTKLEAGEAIEHLPKHLQPRMGFRGAYGRLHPTRAAWTITANCDYPSRGRFSHYSFDRGISMREAARLQSFPDEFHFIGPREHVARQIGNAVPPLVARAFATAIAASITAEIESQIESEPPVSTSRRPALAAAP
jgi:DNA (cytosine-5)-methyltransferase 1